MVTPYVTCESLSSFVVQVMVAPAEVTDDAMEEITGVVNEVVPLLTATLMAREVVVIPAPSRATAVRL
jgi:hypothetical protein